MIIRNFILACVLVLGLFVSAVADIDSGLVAYYKFDSNTNDSSGNGNHGEAVNTWFVDSDYGLPEYSTGIDNQAIGLNYNASIRRAHKFYVSHRDELSLTDWTISFWLEGGFGTGSILSKGSNYSIIFSDGKIATQYESLDSHGLIVERRITSNENISSNWVFIVSTRNSLTGEFKLYLNGTLSASNTWVNDSPLDNSSEMNIHPYLRSYLVDELRIYNRALSDSEIQELYTGNPSCTSAKAGMVSPGLDIHMPSLNYETLLGTQNIWVDFEYYGESPEGELLWKLKGYGEN